MIEGGVLRELVDLADQFVRETRVDCPNLPGRHETTCQCEPHQRVRSTGERLEAMIAELRNA